MVSQAAHGVVDGLVSVCLNEVLQVGDRDSHDAIGEVLRRDPVLISPADGNVRGLVDDSAVEVLDGHLELLCCGVEEILSDALPDFWQIGDTAGDELEHEVLQEARDARAEDESRWMLMDCREMDVTMERLQ